MPFTNPLSGFSKYCLTPLILLTACPAVLSQGAKAAILPNEHTVALAWEAVPETNVTGYRVHVGTQSGVYTQTREAGLDLSHVVTNLEFGKTYYFAVSAVNENAEASDFSTELAVTLAPPPPTTANTLSLTAPGQADLRWQYSKLDAGSTTEFVIYASSNLVTWNEAGIVLPSQPAASVGDTLVFSWPMETTAGKMFFRVTARSPEGES